jgi:hypothetical protein
VDFVDEQHVAGLQAREDRREVADALDGRPGRDANAHLHLGRDDVGERGLAEARRPVQQDVVERLAAATRRRDTDADVLFDLLLIDVLGKALRAEREVCLDVAVRGVAVSDALRLLAGGHVPFYRAAVSALL